MMKSPNDPFDSAFTALRECAAGDAPTGMVDAVMALVTITAPRSTPFPLGALAAVAVACMVVALSAALSLTPEEGPEPPPALALFRADTAAGRPFTLP